MDSRGETTISFTIKTNKGNFNTKAPSGKSKGRYEAKPWNETVLHDVMTLNEMKLYSVESMSEIEKISKVYSKLLGANSRFVLEASLLKAWAKEHGMDLWELMMGGKKHNKMPLPVGNAIGGGLHSSKDNTMRGVKDEFQEFLFIASQKTKTFSQAIKINDKAYKIAYEMLKNFDKDFKGERNDEGAWKTGLSDDHVLKIMYIIAKKLNLRIGIDAASSSFYDKFYKYHDRVLNDTGQINYIKHLISDYELFYVEDPLYEKEFYFFSKLMSEINHNKTLIVGDDLTVTNYERLKKAIRKRSINAIIIKPNQNGSIISTTKVVNLAKEHNIKIIVSHRSGETTDDTIADLAVGWGADFLKCGIHGKERRAKINRMIRIEKELNRKKKK